MNASVSSRPPSEFSGLWVPLITPFVGQAVDHETLGRLVKHLVSAGVTGLVVCGSTGEAAALSAEEQLAVLRTVAMLANEAADAVLQGVASAADVDLAMRKGVNYPQGPLAWADAIGLHSVLAVLDNLQASYGESRYRPSLLIRRSVAEGSTLHD